MDWTCSYGVVNCPECVRPSVSPPILKAEKVSPTEKVSPIKKYNSEVPTKFRVWLNVPFSEKNVAKALGARWDMDRRSWYADSREITSKFARWLPQASKRQQTAISTVPTVSKPIPAKMDWSKPKLTIEPAKSEISFDELMNALEYAERQNTQVEVVTVSNMRTRHHG